MQFLETRSGVKFKVTVIQLWFATLCNPKMHPHTKFEITLSNNIRDMLRTRSGTDGQCDYYIPNFGGVKVWLVGHFQEKLVYRCSGNIMTHITTLRT